MYRGILSFISGNKEKEKKKMKKKMNWENKISRTRTKELRE